MLLGNLSLAVAALFSGAALYVNFAEQPARLKLDDRSLLAEWKPSYKRGFIMQAPLAAAGRLLGFGAWWMTGRQLFAVGPLLMIANWPSTVFAIMPTNKLLIQMDLAASGPRSRALILKRSRLHAVRSGLGVLAMSHSWLHFQTNRLLELCWAARSETRGSNNDLGRANARRTKGNARA
jgi:hypothetical protein